MTDKNLERHSIEALLREMNHYAEWARYGLKHYQWQTIQAECSWDAEYRAEKVEDAAMWAAHVAFELGERLHRGE